ncbi:MAG: phosphotransferase enzyme family protein [Verrucomicrobiales bacterium]
MHDLTPIASLFDTGATFMRAEPYGNGHINDTYLAHYDCRGTTVRYIHQRINHQVFQHPTRLMENISRVTQHALQRLLETNHPEPRRHTLTCIPSLDGKAWAQDSEGQFWRTYPFIERTIAYEQMQTPHQAYEAARCFGEFQQLADDLPGPPLHETIPDFHHTPRRLHALTQAADQATVERSREAARWVDLALSFAPDCYPVVNGLQNGSIPSRVTHNDTKLNNVLLDERTSEGVCVIDLDTTMQGSALYDFGDMVRTMCPTSRELQQPAESLGIRLEFFRALTRGYLQSTHSVLVPRELELLAFSGKLLALECGIRFLTDYLQSDIYFKTLYPAHNLDRARNQFALVRAIEARLSELEDIVAETITHVSQEG